MQAAEAEALAAIRGFLEAASLLPPDGSVTPDTALLEGGAIDSLGILQLTAHLEDTLGLQFSDEDFLPENFETVGSLMRFAARQIEARATA
ncbi:MAG: acyl carrier protein [Hyphomonadaceae bacterium]